MAQTFTSRVWTVIRTVAGLGIASTTTPWLTAFHVALREGPAPHGLGLGQLIRQFTNRAGHFRGFRSAGLANTRIAAPECGNIPHLPKFSTIVPGVKALLNAIFKRS